MHLLYNELRYIVQIAKWQLKRRRNENKEYIWDITKNEAAETEKYCDEKVLNDAGLTADAVL